MNLFVWGVKKKSNKKKGKWADKTGPRKKRESIRGCFIKVVLLHFGGSFGKPRVTFCGRRHTAHKSSLIPWLGNHWSIHYLLWSFNRTRSSMIAIYLFAVLLRMYIFEFQTNLNFPPFSISSFCRVSNWSWMCTETFSCLMFNLLLFFWDIVDGSPASKFRNYTKTFSPPPLFH